MVCCWFVTLKCLVDRFVSSTCPKYSYEVRGMLKEAQLHIRSLQMQAEPLIWLCTFKELLLLLALLNHSNTWAG